MTLSDQIREHIQQRLDRLEGRIEAFTIFAQDATQRPTLVNVLNCYIDDVSELSELLKKHSTESEADALYNQTVFLRKILCPCECADPTFESPTQVNGSNNLTIKCLTCEREFIINRTESPTSKKK